MGQRTLYALEAGGRNLTESDDSSHENKKSGGPDRGLYGVFPYFSPTKVKNAHPQRWKILSKKVQSMVNKPEEISRKLTLNKLL